MKKKYTKPNLICQELHPETMLCACKHTNPLFNEAQQCGYEMEDLGFVLFADSWIACDLNDPTDQYCYQISTGLIFGS